MRRGRRVVARLAAFVLSSGLALIGLEVVIRLVAPQQLIQLRPDIWQPDEEGLGWRQRGGVDTLVNTGERSVRLVTGEHGHRISGEVGPEPEIRVLALGDSFLVGIQVDYSDLFTARLERLLTRRLGMPVAVVNTGVGGWGPSHYLLEAKRELGRQRYDAVLVALFAGNDIERRHVDRFGPKAPTVRHRLRWPTDLSRRELTGALAYPLNDWLETRSHAFMLAREVLWKQLMRFGLSARGLPDVLLRAEVEGPRWRITAEVLAGLAALARARGIPVFFVLLPGAYQVDPELAIGYASAIGVSPDELDLEQPSRLLGAAMHERGLELLDLLPILRSAALPGAGPLFGRVDTHLSPEGHAVVAAALAGPIQEAIEGSRQR